MSKTFGEGFQQPIDYDTGNPIPGSPQIGIPTTNRPWRAGGNGIVILPDQNALKSSESSNPSSIAPSNPRYTR